ncbi:hypothetical protein SDC9_114133 [bioreactor metagenome]|uniref:Uncharacterized protein n=1 Tax=bioreactor metagenome TaxID=1076179 RepID=A0A645BPA3_9ZZZZ
MRTDDDAVLDPACLLDGSDNHSSVHGATLLHRCMKRPALGVAYCIEGEASGYEGSARSTEFLQGPLDTIINGSDEPRGKLDTQAHSASIDIVSRADSGGILIDLHSSQPVVELDHLTYQLLFTDADHLHHHCITDVLDNEDRSIHSFDVSDYSLFHVCS